MLAMLSSKWLSLTLSLFSALGGAASVLPPPSSSGSLNGTQHHNVASYVQAAYFTNWGIYAPNFQPTDIDPSQLTHILYAFADVSPDTGEAFLSDVWADEQKHFPGDSWNEPGNNLYGCLKQLYLLKLSHRHLKVLLSIGGGLFSQDGHFSFIADGDLRATFVASVVRLIKDYGFDGIDVDFEYPANATAGQDFLDLMTSLRSAFDDLAISNGDAIPYQLTAAVSAVPQVYEYYPIAQLDQVLTYWNLMAYDYSGPWTSFADNQANLYGGSRTGLSTDDAVKHYISYGATARKITIGIPLYGRAFENTTGIGQPYSGVGPGTFQAGMYSYKDLPLPGAEVVEDLVDVASYSYDPVKRELVSYDVPDIVSLKAEYVMSQSMAGCMFWELSTDRTGPESLVWTAGDVFRELDQTLNHIHYPDSKWDNIRNNMGLSSGTTTTLASTSTSWAAAPTTTTIASATMTSTATSTQAPITTTSPNSCLCANVSAWSAGTVYTGGDEVVYGDSLWTAKWWTENDVPGGAAGVWEEEGSCDD